MNAITRDRKGIAALIAAYESTDTPDEAARAFLGACDNAAEIMARLVNRYAWDGRISDRAKRWEEGITKEEAEDETDADEEAPGRMFRKTAYFFRLDQVQPLEGVTE